MALQRLNDAQLAAVTAPLKPTLVLAGAGTGKTRVLTNRILYLVQECGVDPHEILAITFTNKAANEMKKRLFDFRCNAQFMHVSTIHSFCASVLRVEAKSFDRNSNFSIYTEDEKKSLLKKIVKASIDDGASEVVDDLCDGISGLKNNAPELLSDKLSEQEVLDECIVAELEKMQNAAALASREQVLKIIDEYSAKMAENNALDFDDLLFYVHKLFSSFPEILEKYRERYKFVLIDEFQDTNRVQYQIFKMLGEKYGNIFVVGDDDQSIYSWRGADAHNLLKFSKDFPGCQIYKLEQNYRSTKQILKVANSVISLNGGRFEKELWTENEDGVKPQIFSAFGERDEAYYVCEQIKQLRALGGYKFSDFAVLMRVNALSRSFEQEFQMSSIPFKVFGGFKFFERKEIKDVLAYLRLVVNQYDSEALFRAINVPRKRGIGDTTLGKLRELSAEYGISIVDVISDERNLECLKPAARKKLLEFYALYANLVEISGKLSVPQFVHEMLNLLEFRQAYKELDEDERVMNIDEFEQSVIEFATAFPTASLADYLQNVSLASDIDEANNGDYVTVATVHAVKGLEFRVVFVVGLEEGIFPVSRAVSNVEALSEERRLMYVAATRAEKRLYLTRANSRFMWGNRRQSAPSRYFNEIQKTLQPQRAPLSESQMDDFNLLDRVNSRQPSQSAPNPGKSSSEVALYKVGQIVEHATYGEGMILRISGNVGDFAFKSVGKKSLDLRFAPLKIKK